MSYTRVIPRDLFNEANLLKCIGRLYLNLESLNTQHAEIEHDGETFDVQQNPDDGSISVANVSLFVRGYEYPLHRPLNSRDAWPLYLTTGDGDDIEVFSDDGEFSPEMLTLLGVTSP